MEMFLGSDPYTEDEGDEMWEEERREEEQRELKPPTTPQQEEGEEDLKQQEMRVNNWGFPS
jgi:hypothetical protein